MKKIDDATAGVTEDRLIDSWTRATEEVFEGLTNVKPQMHWEERPQSASTPDQLAAFKWWEAQYEAAGHCSVWIGVPTTSALELVRLAQAVATADQGDSRAETSIVEETMEALCKAFSVLLSRETGGRFQYRDLKLMETAPSPEVVYSAEIRISEESTLPILVGFGTQMKAALEHLVECLPPQSRAPDTEEGERGPLGLLLDLELPLSIRFGQAELPIEQVLGLREGSVIELDRSHDEPVDLIINGSVVARGEVVAVEGNYGVRILEILHHGRQSVTSRGQTR